MASLVPQSTSNCTTAATTTLMTGRKSFPGKPYLSNRRSLNVSRTSATGNPGNLLLANADLFYNKRAINNEYMTSTLNSSLATATTRPNNFNSNNPNTRTIGNTNILCTSSPPSETQPRSNSQWNGA